MLNDQTNNQQKEITIVELLDGKTTNATIDNGTTASELIKSLGYNSDYTVGRVRGRHIFKPNDDITNNVKNGENFYIFPLLEFGDSND